MQLRKYILSFFFLSAGIIGNTQVVESYQKLAELGMSTGVAHYFGDLNPNAAVNCPKTTTSLFFTKQFNNYLGIKIAGTYAQLGYADKYSSNYVQQRRNLSFNTDIWELSVMGDFNFYEFYPGLRGSYTFTPYMGLGVGIFSYDPYAYLQGQKYYLRDLGTEGQLANGGKSYNKTAVCFPLCLGVKVNLTRRLNFYTELCYRLTTTDYIDDVSGNYSPDSFNPNAGGNQLITYQLQDRSYETGSRIGIQGRQRGNSSRNDAYVTLQVGLSLNFLSYLCPGFN
ncbi:MAG: DUF6089 family protein [Bacteroidota bacterium]|jgi:Domain of unknown function (DUF6089)